MDHLRDFLSNLDPSFAEKAIRGLCVDSRKVRPGDLYFAFKGSKRDGHQFVNAAIENGAIGVVAESAVSNVPVPVLVRKDARRIYAEAAAANFKFPSDGLCVVGVTGTSGKTTVTFLVESILNIAHPGLVGVIGTTGCRLGEKKWCTEHTTPDAMETQKILSEMKVAGAKSVVMEVSSHALDQWRVGGIAFDVVTFLNLSPEHLDYHADMEAYYLSKRRLFEECAEYSKMRGKSPIRIANEKDSFGCRLVDEGSQGFGQSAETLLVTKDGIRGSLEGVPVKSPLLGSFNCENIEAAVRVALALGIETEAIEKGVSSLEAVPGRLERVEDPGGRHILVDYAHKPEALRSVLKTLRQISEKETRLVLVFGCGGDRDQKKRPQMGQIAAEFADRVFVTSDNPRTEDPKKIIDMILNGIPREDLGKITVEPDRRQAISRAIQETQKGDWILIAGKGHEDYQIIGAEKRPFDDRDEAKRAIGVAL